MDHTEITDYLAHFVHEKEPILKDIEKKAIQDGVPIMEPLAIEALLQFLTVQKPKRLLEIGTAVGYSALKMARRLPDLSIVTVERDDQMYRQAVSNIERLDLSSRIQVIHADAIQAVEEIKEKAPYDALFIDAAKAQNRLFFETFGPMVEDDGVIFTDNILFKGFVTQDTTKLESKPLKRLVEKIQDFNTWLMNHPDYHTAWLPVEDGLAVSMKIKRQTLN